MTNLWTIRPLFFGEFPEYEKSWCTYMRNAGEKIRVPAVGWLLQSGGENILVDTGPPPPAIANQFHTHMEQTVEQRPEVALRNAGVDAAGLELVIFTHLHWDHCHNVELFSAARFVVQRQEVHTAVDPISTQRVTYESRVPGLHPPWFPVLNRLEMVDGDVELAPGLHLIVLPGHTPGLQGILVETTKGRHLIASDALPLYENLGADQTEDIPPGLHYDVAASLRSLNRMREVAEVVLPGHDLQVFQQPLYPVF